MQRDLIIQRLPSPGGVGEEAPPTVDAVRQSPGQPLPTNTRGFMETRFGHDFGHVRIHTDSQAAESAQLIQAQAYTIGRDVIFAAGHYAPESRRGQHLLAHELTHVIQQQGQSHPSLVQRTGETGSSLLHPCSSWPQASGLSTILTAASRIASQAVQGLQDVIDNWGNDLTTPLQMATAMALRRGFNMEPDKSAWSAIGIDPAETQRIDQRDRTAAQTIRDNFQAIATDAPNYQSAPACTNRLVSGNPCIGCVDDAHHRCSGETVAFVIPQMLGQPSSPVLLCRRFFQGSTEENAEKFLHELAHLQTFTASDYVGDVRYYGCPVVPIEGGGPGLQDPNEFIGVADAYRCFLQTLRIYKGLYEERVRAEARTEATVRSATEPVSSPE